MAHTEFGRFHNSYGPYILDQQCNITKHKHFYVKRIMTYLQVVWVIEFSSNLLIVIHSLSVYNNVGVNTSYYNLKIVLIQLYKKNPVWRIGSNFCHQPTLIDVFVLYLSHHFFFLHYFMHPLVIVFIFNLIDVFIVRKDKFSCLFVFMIQRDIQTVFV